MKRIASILIATAVLCGSVPKVNRYNIFAVQEQKAPAPGIGPVLFVLIVTAGGGYLIYRLWVSLKAPAPAGTYYWELQKSTDHVNWTPVATNAARMTSEKAWEMFEVYCVDKTAFYRIKMVDYVAPYAQTTNTFAIWGTETAWPIPQPQ